MWLGQKILLLLLRFSLYYHSILTPFSLHSHTILIIHSSISIYTQEREFERNWLEKRKKEIENAKEQISALLSFKEALCTPRVGMAISVAFREFWRKEQLALQDNGGLGGGSNEDDKQNLAICFGYIRRMLAIDANPTYSSSGDLVSNRLSHFRFIVQMRQILSTLPGILSDLLRPYHNDWLTEVLLIIYYAMQVQT